jgi:hypothetical protein
MLVMWLGINTNMPRYKSPEPFFDGQKIIPAGQEFSYDGIPGRKWECLDTEPKEDAPRRGRPPKADTVE